MLYPRTFRHPALNRAAAVVRGPETSLAPHWRQPNFVDRRIPAAPCVIPQGGDARWGRDWHWSTAHIRWEPTYTRRRLASRR